jgi:hypothetical protein
MASVQQAWHWQLCHGACTAHGVDARQNTGKTLTLKTLLHTGSNVSGHHPIFIKKIQIGPRADGEKEMQQNI